MCSKQLLLILILFGILTSQTLCGPDSAGIYPQPGPGLAHGGIPYGSMSGNVAEFFKHQAPSNRRSGDYQYDDPVARAPNFAPIEQYL